MAKMKNPNLCEHVWKYGTCIQTTGTLKPINNIILYCEKCAKIKPQKLKLN